MTLIGSRGIKKTMDLELYIQIQKLWANGKMDSGNTIVMFLPGTTGRPQIDGVARAICGNWENLHLII